MGIGLGGFQGGGAAAVLAPGATGADLTLTSTATALKFTATQTTGNDAFVVQANGARVHFGAGASDFASSDGTTVTFAGPVTAAGALQTSAGIDITSGRSFLTSAANAGVAVLGTNGILQFTSLIAQNTAPTVSAGAGASVTANNGTFAFTINLGAAAQTGTITLPTASTGWVVYMQDVTTPASFVLSQTGGTATTATFTCYSRTTGLAINWTANDIARCMAIAY